MQRAARSSFLFALIMLLSGCTPALYTRLLKATGELISVTNTATNDVVTIAPGTAADISTYDPHEHLVVRSSKQSWSYSLFDFYQTRLPLSFQEQHAGVMRSYTRIDSEGRIYVLAPPSGGHEAREVPQPPGFPLSPRKKT